MRIAKTILAIVLLVGCLAGTGFVIWDTATRRTPSVDVGPEAAQDSSTPTTDPTAVDKFPISVTKNPFTPLVQLPATATTQPKS